MRTAAPKLGTYRSIESGSCGGIFLKTKRVPTLHLGKWERLS